MNTQQISSEPEKDRRFIKIQKKGFKQQKFQFKTYELAFTVREILYQKIINFDKNHDMQFQQSEIRDFLISVLHENENQIHYFIKNVFRYDYDNDGVIVYDELVNFCMEQHLGQIAIQRLHRQNKYGKGSQRLMNEEEFIQTINYALSFLHFSPKAEQLQALFSSVDLDNDGYISYQDYFRLLKEYLGSKSFAAGLVNTKTVIEQLDQEKQNPSKKQLDIVRKYSKYQNTKNINQIKPNIINTNHIKKNSSDSINSQLNGMQNNQNAQIRPDSRDLQSSKASNQSQNTNRNDGNSQNSNLNPRQNEGNNHQNLQKKPRPSISQGIQLTLANKQNNSKQPKFDQITLSESEAITAGKIARLVLTQLKVIVINFNKGKNLALSYEQITNSLKTILRVNQNSIYLLCKKYLLSGDTKLSYTQMSKMVIVEKIIQVFQQNGISESNKLISQTQFINICDKICRIVPNTPLQEKYQDLYRLRISKNSQFSFSQAQALLTCIFNDYPL